MSGLSEAQREMFRLMLTEWQTKLNLLDWRINLSEKCAARGVMADVKPHYSHKLASVRLGTAGWQTADLRLIETTALHELLHVFLASLIAVARDTNASADALAAAEHSVINVLEALLVPEKD